MPFARGNLALFATIHGEPRFVPQGALITSRLAGKTTVNGYGDVASPDDSERNAAMRWHPFKKPA